jgi:LPS sulfotransferase NodH
MSAACERAYLILTLERTGSNLLCHALSRMNCAGTPSEWFGYMGLHARAESVGAAKGDSTPDSPVLTSLQDYVRAMAARFSKGGVFGAKVHRYQFLQLQHNGLATGPLDLLPDGCRQTARLVLLTREDRRRQAISTYLARSSGVYAVSQENDGSPLVEHRNPHWTDPQIALRGNQIEALDEILTEIVEHEHEWKRWCEACDLPVMSVTYEDLCDNYAGTVARACSHLTDRDVSEDEVPPAVLRIQRGAETERLLRLWIG